MRSVREKYAAVQIDDYLYMDEERSCCCKICGLKDAICNKKLSCCYCSRNLNIEILLDPILHNLDTYKDYQFMQTVPVKYTFIREF